MEDINSLILIHIQCEADKMSVSLLVDLVVIHSSVDGEDGVVSILTMDAGDGVATILIMDAGDGAVILTSRMKKEDVMHLLFLSC